MNRLTLRDWSKVQLGHPFRTLDNVAITHYLGSFADDDYKVGSLKH